MEFNMVSLTLFYSFVACAFLMVSSKEAICRFLHVICCTVAVAVMIFCHAEAI